MNCTSENCNDIEMMNLSRVCASSQNCKPPIQKMQNEQKVILFVSSRAHILYRIIVVAVQNFENKTKKVHTFRVRYDVIECSFSVFSTLCKLSTATTVGMRALCICTNPAPICRMEFHLFNVT